MPKRILQGTVVSDKGDKTIVVKVESTFKHPLFGKTLRKSRKYHAHDAENSCKVGDTVQIVEAMPISKMKRFALLNKLQSAEVAE